MTVDTHDKFIVLPHWEMWAASTMTQLQYPDTERTSPCHILLMSSVRLGEHVYTDDPMIDSLCRCIVALSIHREQHRQQNYSSGSTTGSGEV